MILVIMIFVLTTLRTCIGYYFSLCSNKIPEEKIEEVRD